MSKKNSDIMLKKKRNRTPKLVQGEDSNKISDSLNKMTENKQIINKYLTLNIRNNGNNTNLSFVDKSFSTNLVNIKTPKKDYKFNCQELYDNKNKAYYQVRTAKILIHQNKYILFVQVYNKLILYEIKNDSFIFIKEFLFKDFGIEKHIDKFFFYENENESNNRKNIIDIIFISNDEIILSKFYINNFQFELISKHNISSKYGCKIFHKIIGGNKMMVLDMNELYIVRLYPSFLKKKTYINSTSENSINNISILDNDNIIGICREKELIIYDSNMNKKLGKINFKKEIINPGLRITKYLNKNESLFILFSEKGVYLYDYKKLSLVKELSLQKYIKTKIRKVKSLQNNIISILYNYFNFALYNVEKDMLLYKFKSNWTKSPGNEDFPILTKMSNDILVFGSDPKTVTILNYLKGDVLGSISSKEKNINFILCKSIEIYEENKMYSLNDSLIYSFIKNSKTTLMLKLSC